MGEHRLRGIVLCCIEDDSKGRPNAEQIADWLQQENSRGEQKKKIAQRTSPGQLPKLEVVLIGPSGTGKSCIMKRFIHNNFSENEVVTIGEDFGGKSITLHDKAFYLQILDTAGQERFNSIPQNFSRGADGVLLVFDLTRKTTFDEGVPVMLEIVNRHITCSTKIVLVGNKVDAENSKRQVTRLEAEEYARRLGVSYFETSAKTGKDIERVFEEIAKQIYDTLGLSDIEAYFSEADGSNVLIEEKAEEKADSSRCSC